MPSSEIESFRLRFEHEFRRLLKAIEGLDRDAVNWKPPAPGANSLLVLVTHSLASAEDHVVRRAAGKPVSRDRDAEFRTIGDASTLSARATEVLGRIRDALTELDGRLDEEREKGMREWVGRWTARDTLIHSIAHTAEHAGHAELTRDLLKGEDRSPSPT